MKTDFLGIKLVLVTFSLLVSSAFSAELGGHYRGVIFETSFQTSLPDRVTMNLRINPSATPSPMNELLQSSFRLYNGDFSSSDYVKVETESTSYNLITKKLVVRASVFGSELTFDLERVAEGVFRGDVLSELGKVGEIVLGRFKLN